MRIEQLEYIAAVTRCGSVRRASEQLHVSQPAMSQAITKLEKELGVVLLERHRSGARISRAGRDLLQSMTDVLDSVDRLTSAAHGRRTTTRTIHLGTVNAATATLLLPAVRALQRTHPSAAVEVRNVQQSEIAISLAEGSMDLGLVNLLDGDDPAPDVVATPLLHGRPVVVMPVDHPLAEYGEVEIDDLRSEPFVAMRAGYLMHRFAHRVFGPQPPASWHTTDGAEMGKVMVAEGLGVTLLPDYSVTGDPLERAGLITSRPIAGDDTRLTLVVEHSRRGQPAAVVRDLLGELAAQAERVHKTSPRRRHLSGRTTARTSSAGRAGRGRWSG